MKNVIKSKVLELTGLDIFKKTRDKEYIHARSLFYKTLTVECKMTDRSISEFMLQNGLKTNRTTIFFSIKKFPEYCKHNQDLKHYYNILTSRYDKMNKVNILKENLRLKERNVKLFQRVKYLEEIVKEHNLIAETKYTFTNEKLVNLVKNVPEEKTKVVFDRLNLLIKSWAWKEKPLVNHCKVYTAS